MPQSEWVSILPGRYTFSPMIPFSLMAAVFYLVLIGLGCLPLQNTTTWQTREPMKGFCMSPMCNHRHPSSKSPASQLRRDGILSMIDKCGHSVFQAAIIKVPFNEILSICRSDYSLYTLVIWSRLRLIVSIENPWIIVRANRIKTHSKCTFKNTVPCTFLC